MVGCGDASNCTWRATESVGTVARMVEAASKVWQDYSLIILNFTKHQYIHQQLYNWKHKSKAIDDATQEEEITQTTD